MNTPKTKVGFSNIQAIALLIVAFFNQALESFKDGIQGKDFLSFIDEFMSIAGASESFKEVRSEIADLDQTELAQLEQAVIDKLAINNPVVKKLVKAILDLIVAGANAFYAFKEFKEWKASS
jgi:hypothetical protein